MTRVLSNDDVSDRDIGEDFEPRRTVSRAGNGNERTQDPDALDGHDVRDTHDPVEALGPMMRDLRKRKGLTLSDVAARAGLSVGHLSQVERGLSTPTIRQLQEIAHTMGVTIGWFFRRDGVEGSPEDEAVVVRAARRRRMEIANLGILDELLVPDLDGALELLLCTLDPGCGSGPEAYSHDGEEAGLILSGEMELFVDERRYLLSTGDSFAFKSTSPHRYRNCGTTPLKIVWAITPPSY